MKNAWKKCFHSPTFLIWTCARAGQIKITEFTLCRQQILLLFLEKCEKSFPHVHCCTFLNESVHYKVIVVQFHEKKDKTVRSLLLWQLSLRAHCGNMWLNYKRYFLPLVESRKCSQSRQYIEFIIAFLLFLSFLLLFRLCCSVFRFFWSVKCITNKTDSYYYAHGQQQ